MKVGDYVRTEYGIIGKITKIIDGELDEAYLNFKNMCVYSKNCLGNKGKIIKSSPNIIDLIEVGDYVNGEKVIRLFNPTFLSMGELPYVITDKNKYEPQEIKSIVTKEQFESMKYKIGE